MRGGGGGSQVSASASAASRPRPSAATRRCSPGLHRHTRRRATRDPPQESAWDLPACCAGSPAAPRVDVTLACAACHFGCQPLQGGRRLGVELQTQPQRQ